MTAAGSNVCGARHLLRRAVARSPDAMKRFVAPGADGTSEPQFKASLVDHLLRIQSGTNVRDLEATLWRAMSESTGDAIEWRDAGTATVTMPPTKAPSSSEASAEAESDAPEPTAEEIRASLQRTGGNVVRTAQALGLSSRYALYRLMRKYGIEADGARGG